MALEQIAANSSPSTTYARINAAIAETSRLTGAVAGIANDLASRLLASTALTDRVSVTEDAIFDLRRHNNDYDVAIQALRDRAGVTDGRIDDLGAYVAPVASDVLVLKQRQFDFLAASNRPGDSPLGFVVVPSRALLSGDGRSITEIVAGQVAVGDHGRAVRITGAGVVAQRRPVPVEAARVYRARYVVQRRTNPSDPSNDSVVLGILWLDANLNIIAPTNDATIVEDVRDLTAAYGRQERAVLFSPSPAPDAQFRAPMRARYARAFVQTYGLDGITDVEVLGIDDVSLATILAPETVDTVQRVGALESQNAGQRLTALENQVSAPNSVTFATKSDAAGGAIPSTVTTVALRGLTQAGDGGDGIYKRISGTAPAGSDSFINQGVTFVRVFTSADVLGALLNSLPTTLPSVAGRAWLNGGVLAVS